MRPVNLIPAEDRRGDHAPLRAGVASYAILGVLALGLIAVVLVVLTNNDIKDSKAQLTTLQARQAQAQTTSTDLAPYTNFASVSQARAETVSSLAQTRFDWQRVLNELALVIPPRVTLLNLTGTASSNVALGAASSSSSSSDSISGPSLLIDGCAEGQEGVAAFLAALKDIDGVTRVGMQSSALGASDSASAAASSADAATDDCQTKASIAKFEITVAFDAVPIPLAAAAGATGTPTAAPTTTTPAPTTTTAAPTTTTSTTPTETATQSEQQSAVDSANEQISKAKSGASAVGVDGE